MPLNNLPGCASYGGIARVVFRNSLRVEHHIVPFRCGKPECEICRNIKRKRIMRRLEAAEWPQTIVMWTITTDPKVLSPGEALKTMNHRWHKLCRNLLREYPGIKFFRVMEFTESGLPHLHVMFNRRVEWKLLQRLVQAQEFGKVLNFKVLPRSVAFGYLTKYITKGLAAYPLSRENHIRCWSASMKFLPSVYYFDGQTEYSIVWTGRLNEDLESVLDLCNKHDSGERAPPDQKGHIAKGTCVPASSVHRQVGLCVRPAE